MGIPQASKQKTNRAESQDLGDQCAFPLEMFLMLGAEGVCLCWFRVPAMGRGSEGVHMKGLLLKLGPWTFGVRTKTHKAKGLRFRLSIQFGFLGFS